MISRKELAHLTATLARRTDEKMHSASMIVADAIKLSRIAATVSRHAVNLCNVPDYQKVWDAKTPGLLLAAFNVALQYGCTAKIQGDPRGHVLRLFAKPGAPELRGNTWGGDEDGYGIM